MVAAGTIVFKAKSKFMHMVKSGDKTNWESKGVGTFMLRVRNDDSKKPFVTFTTEAVGMAARCELQEACFERVRLSMLSDGG